MSFLGGLAKLGVGALNVSTKVGGAAAKVGESVLKAGGKFVKGTTKLGTSRVFMKEASEKTAESLSFIDKVFQEATGLAKEGADGAMKYKTLTGPGFAAVASLPMIASTGKAISGSSAQSARGMVSVADGMDRFISYDGSGFVENFADVTGGDSAIGLDVVNHAFTSQSSAFNNNSLGDIVFALHANREG